MDAMQECIRVYGNVVWRMTRQFSAEREEAEDLVQEVFTAVWRSAKRFESDKWSELAFIATIARRRMIDWGRRRGRRPQMQSLQEPSEICSRDESSAPELADEMTRVRAALERLRPEQRQVLELCLMHGLTRHEVAERTGLALGTVKSHARRGLMRVRELLGVPSEASATRGDAR